MADIQLVNLTRTYRQGSHVVTALDEVDLLIEKGEFTSIVGRSGSGKTTLLDLTGLLLRPTSGTILFAGEDTSKLSDRRRADLRARRIGFVFQEYNLLPGLTVVENVLLASRYAGADRREGRRRARELLEMTGLGERLSHRPDQLSGAPAAAGGHREGAGQPAGGCARRRADRGGGHADVGGAGRADATPQS